MAKNPGKPKFPDPIPNPLSPGTEDKTDPHLEAPPKGSVLHKSASGGAPSPATSSVSGAPSPANSGSVPGMPDLGPLTPLMKDPSISEIMINDLRNVMIEREGKLIPSGVSLSGIDELNRLIHAILEISGKAVTAEMPYVDTMLADGSRVNIVVPPLTVSGPSITIRKFPARQLLIQDLMNSEMLDQRIAYFLNVCVVGKLNILICGGTGSGKTTLLNVLASFIPKTERIITIEDTPELILSQINSVRLQTKPQTPNSAAISARELVANSLRMRPDRLIVGECRRSEAFDMLQAMNTGHSGSMTTLHANSPRDGLARLETLCLLAGVDLPMSAIRKQMTSAIDLIVQVKRFRNGKRRITNLSEVTGMEGETITLQDLFVFDVDLNSPSNPGETGRFKATGYVPKFLDRLRENGIELPQKYFA